MKLLLFYFSGAGYTRWVVRRFGSLLAQKGHTARIEAIESCNIADILDEEMQVDYIGFAYPIYAANIPRIMRGSMQAFLDAAKAHPALPKKLLLINTFAYVNGHGYLEARKIFKRSPFQIQGYVNVKMPNSASAKRRAFRRKDDSPGDALAKAAQHRLETLLTRLSGGRRYLNGLGPQIIGGKLVRRVLRDQIANTYRRMRVDTARCTLCMRCVNTCPAHCIQHSDSGFEFTDACEACMRCVHRCPASAISVE